MIEEVNVQGDRWGADDGFDLAGIELPVYCWRRISLTISRRLVDLCMTHRSIGTLVIIPSTVQI